jgi:phospholipase C
VCGDLTTAFDFEHPEWSAMPTLPEAGDSIARVAEHKKRPKPAAPSAPEMLFQEPGTRPSRALPYELNVSASNETKGALTLTFRNSGKSGAVFQVYDKLALERIPRRYTVEAGKSIADSWSVEHEYDLWVCGPNGFLREFRGMAPAVEGHEEAIVDIRYEKTVRSIQLVVSNPSKAVREFTVHNSVYGSADPWSFIVSPGKKFRRTWSLEDSQGWYDLTVAASTPTAFMRRLAGRLETGAHGVSDPAIGRHPSA